MDWNGKVFDFISSLETTFKLSLSNFENYLHKAPEEVVNEIQNIDLKDYLIKDCLEDHELVEEIRNRNILDLLEDEYRDQYARFIEDYSTSQLIEELKKRPKFEVLGLYKIKELAEEISKRS